MKSICTLDICLLLEKILKSIEVFKDAGRLESSLNILNSLEDKSRRLLMHDCVVSLEGRVRGVVSLVAW